MGGESSIDANCHMVIYLSWNKKRPCEGVFVLYAEI